MAGEVRPQNTKEEACEVERAYIPLGTLHAAWPSREPCILDAEE